MLNSIHGFRLSAQQRRLWSLQEDSFTYRAQCAILIEGNLEIEVLKRAFQKVVNQHEILRTTFHCRAGISIPIQVIADSSILIWNDVDLNDWSPKVQEAKIEELFQQERYYPFDSEQDPLLRSSLLILSSQQHILLISLPSLCADTWTLKNLVYDLSYSYEACFQDKEVSNNVIQYVQFSEWQNELLENEDSKKGKEYWRKQSIRAFPILKLPSEGHLSKNLRFEPKSIALIIEPSTVTKIEAIVQEYATSVSVFLLACWQTLLWRLTGQTEIVVDKVYNGRKHEELYSVMGLFAKSIPIYCRFQESFRFKNILALLTEDVSAAYEWQDYFILEDSEEITKETANFHFASFEFEELPSKQYVAGASFSIYKQYVCFDRFKIKLSCIRTDSSLTTEFHYNAQVFSIEDIERMAGQFKTLLQSVIDNPEITIERLEILSNVERHQLLVKFNDTRTDYPEDKCIHQLFEEQAKRTPDSIAAVFENQHLAYAELNAQANQLAHYLQTLGIGPEKLVAVCVERSLNMVVGLLGILKAGGVYLPLDPAYPKERLTFILEDAQVPVLLSSQQLIENWSEYKGCVVCLDADWQVIAQKSRENPISKADPDNLAYVIYTSGSTGQPKGTMIPHRGLVNYLSWCTKAYAVADGYGAPVHSSIGFDATITSLFSPLLVGQKVVLLPGEQEIEILSTVLQSTSSFSLIKITPAHLELLNQLFPSQEAAGRTRALIIGGEALSGKSLSYWHTHAPETRIINEYGPTETVVGCCVYEVPAQNFLLNEVPIGSPIANTQIYLLDKHLQPVPTGVAGELHIGGTGLARGYLNRPELTSEKFIPHPFSTEPGVRLYKTGDLARYLADGNIEFLGRIDQQVKIRGFRIELGEIEAVLGQHPQVRKAVVIVQGEVPGNKRLVAYIIPQQQPAPTTRELRRFLQEKLPEYMVPAAFVTLEALPLTPNGKIDRQALPAPASSRSGLEASFVAPRTPIEEILATIWAEVLGLEQIGIYDNFFELGGDSILSIQIIARANQVGLALAPRKLFQYQTIAELAAVAGTTIAIQSQQDLVTGPVPLTPIQYWFLEQNLPENHHFNQSVLLKVPPDLKPELLEQIVQQLLVQHDALRLQFVFEDSNWQQVSLGLGKTVPFTLVDLSLLVSAAQQHALEAAAAELQASLSLSEGRIIQVALFHLGSAQPSRLLLVIHHLAVDGVSWRILLGDFSTLYQQLRRGEAMQLPPKTTSFQDWAQRLRKYGQSAALAADLNYWLELSSASVTALPVDYLSEKQSNTVASAAQVSVVLSAAETRALIQEVPSAYNTQINDVLLTALVQSFAQWTGKRSLLIDLEGHGREDIFEDVDLSRTVGWFTSIFPILLEVVAHPGEALKLVKEQLRRLPHRGISYGLLRYLSQGTATPRQLRALPQAEVSFNYLGQLDQVWSESLLLGPAKESKGPVRSPLGRRSHLLEVNGFVFEGRLHLDWTYSENVHQRATVERLAQGFMGALQDLIVHCQSLEVGGYTPSDFPEAELSQKSLDKLIAKIEQTGRR